MSKTLPFQPAFRLSEQAPDCAWLIEELWAQDAVGIIGGEPKCCKSFLALTLAVAVGSGKPCFGRFTVPKRGKVLLYPAEDSLPVVRKRLEGICAASEVDLAQLPVFVITHPGMRIDIDSDYTRLKNTVERVKPCLVILDPFVRLHAIDENVSGEVASLLNKLRHLQRSLKTAIALVHHSKKGASKQRGGQALRGSSEFHAWGDSNLYLRRNSENRMLLTVEHRAHPSPPPLTLDLMVGENPHLREITSVHEQTTESPPDPETQIITALGQNPQPIRSTTLRKLIRCRNTTYAAVLDSLIQNGTVIKTPDGLSLSNPPENL